MWVFGYGSLVWKVDFPYETKVVGYIKGYNRRFFQHSIDHRGTNEKPGRVVTLIPSEDSDAQVWGIAYKIHSEDIERVTDHLDFREKNGYSKKSIKFFPQDRQRPPIELYVYLATDDNVSYAGPAPIPIIADQIVRCSGPSGTNKDYLYRLADSMRELVPDIQDTHLFNLEKTVKELDPDFQGDKILM